MRDSRRDVTANAPERIMRVGFNEMSDGRSEQRSTQVRVLREFEIDGCGHDSNFVTIPNYGAESFDLTSESFADQRIACSEYLCCCFMIAEQFGFTIMVALFGAIEVDVAFWVAKVANEEVAER